MAKDKGKLFRSSFTFGDVAAEGDPLLERAYYDNGDYEALASPRDRRCFIIGRTGSGKSATLVHLEQEYPGRVVRITPESLSLPYITNLDVIQYLLGLGVHLEPFFKALWKHIFIVEVIKHRYNISTPDHKTNVLQHLRTRFQRDTAKSRALDYLDEFGDKFWSETDERVRQVTDTFSAKVKSSAGVESKSPLLGIKLGTEAEQADTQTIKAEITRRFQIVVNETQLPRLNDMIRILADEILEAKQHFAYVIIDDLDKEWVDSSVSNTLIRCLFDAVLDLHAVKNLKVLVALRTNIFEQLGYGEVTQGGQEEKFRGASLRIGWTPGDLRGLLKQRAEAASAMYGFDPPRTLNDLLPRQTNDSGDPIEYILARTLMRPRDAILYLNVCARRSAGKTRLTWKALQDAETEYSVERLAALRDEWKDPYTDIDKVIQLFNSKPSRLSRAEITKILDDVALLPADYSFRGTVWLTQLTQRIWSNVESSWEELYAPLVRFFYNIGFIGIARGAQTTAIYSHNEDAFPLSLTELGPDAIFEIHLAFRKGLSMQESSRGRR